MISYFLQIIVFQLLFLLVYEVLLKKETFFTWNRWYLLTTAVISLLLPFLKIEALSAVIPLETTNVFNPIVFPEVIIGENLQNLKSSSSILAAKSPDLNWWLLIYGSGLSGSLIFLYNKYRALREMFKFDKFSVEGKIRIVEIPNSNVACTFFNTIFLGSLYTEAERQQILFHELVHVRQKHSLDLIFFEVLKTVFWFNPLVYIYQSRISMLHEYIADANVVTTTEKRSYYEQLLNSAFNTRNISFTNHFFHQSLTRLTAFGKTIFSAQTSGPVKNRIVMLEKARSKTTAKLKYLGLVPLLLLMLIYVACSNENSARDSGDSLSQYTYTLQKGEGMDARTKEIHVKYEAFLKSNPDFVSWTEFNLEKGEFTYSVHHRNEKVPSEYSIHEITSRDGSFYTAYFIPPLGYNSGAKKETVPLEEIGIGFSEEIDEIPVFENCTNLASSEEKKACMSKMIQRHVQSSFDSRIGAKEGLTGINHILSVFTIDRNGRITNLRVKAPHPALEEEAKRVINNLPQMIPGKQNGENVEVSYSLPITFQITKT